MRKKSKTRLLRFDAFAPASLKASGIASAASKKRDTKPELALRRLLHAQGLRFRVDVASLPGRPDIAFPSSRVAVFVDGDFWHGRQLQARLARLAKGHNANYWRSKILSNRARDRRTNAALRRNNWFVIRVWESDVSSRGGQISAEIARIVRIRRKSGSPDAHAEA